MEKFETTATKFNFLLQPEFPMAGFILAIESLRIANQNSGQILFEWQIITESGQATRASNGMYFSPDCDLNTMDAADVYLLFEGNMPTQHISKKLLGKLRAVSRFGAMVGAVDTAAHALAHAGLIVNENSPDVVLHWEAIPTFREWFPQSNPKNRIFQIDSNTALSAGGVSTLDMMLDLISHYVGEAMANEVANAMIHNRRDKNTRQRNDIRFESEHNSLTSKLIALMQANLDFPMPLQELAKNLNTSERTLTRATLKAFDISPMRLYLRIRLQAARNFIFYDEHSIKEISNACGFSYHAAFSRAFKAQFGVTPTKFRADFRKQQSMREHPEIRRLIG